MLGLRALRGERPVCRPDGGLVKRSSFRFCTIFVVGAVVFAAVAAVSVPPCLRGEVLATCRCGAGKLELVFVLDATGSMGPVIGTVKAQAEKIIEILESQTEDLKVGTVAFRTREDPEMPEPAVCPLTSDRRAFAEWLKGVKAKGGGLEATTDGLGIALRGMKWSKGARKVVILIGDEAPPENEVELFYDLASEAKSRGIILHTITASGTAWLYYLNVLRNRDPAAASALISKYGSMENLKQSFRLPVFEEAARRGGGRAAGSSDMREILMLVLALALGTAEDDAPPELPAVAVRGEEPPRAPARGRTRMGYVSYRGEWRTPRHFAGLLRHLSSIIRIDLDEEPEVVRLDSPSLWRYPLLFMSGHGPVELSEAERRGLRRYAESGGLLWADACCGRKAFDEGFRRQMKKVFPEGALERLPLDHPLFGIGYRIDRVRYAAAHRKGPFHSGEPHVEAIRLGPREGKARRIAVLYTPHSLGAGWKTYPYGPPCLAEDADALRLSENIVLFAMSR